MAAEPWLERGEAELLYSQVVTESEFLGARGSEARPIISRGGFVAVMMRRRLLGLQLPARVQGRLRTP